MIYIIHEGLGGEVDRRPVEHRDEINDTLGKMIDETIFQPGDIIRIVGESE